MSVINQMLDQLEQRGAHTAADQPMVRAVQRTGRNFTMPLIVGALGVVAGIAVSQWGPSRSLPAAVEPAVPKTVVTRSTDTREKLTPRQSGAITTAPVSGVTANVPTAESLASAARLSMELVPPPPAAIRPDSGQPTSPFADGTGQAALVYAASGGSAPASSGGRSKPAAKPAHTAKPRKARPVSPPHPAPAKAEVFASSTPVETVPMKQVSPAQRADAEFRRAITLTDHGHVSDAMAGYETALRLDPGHDAARQALVALLLEQKRNADAEKVLLEGLGNKPEHIGFTMLLARVQVERGALDQAIATLEKSLPLAAAQADYRAFLAALLQRNNRNDDAISHYQIALRQAPGNGVWLMGYGISLEAAQRKTEAKDAFKRALDTRTLSPELQAFVQQKLKGL
jgi:MSHA biogenesis protein MshN